MSVSYNPPKGLSFPWGPVSEYPPERVADLTEHLNSCLENTTRQLTALVHEERESNSSHLRTMGSTLEALRQKHTTTVFDLSELTTRVEALEEHRQDSPDPDDVEAQVMRLESRLAEATTFASEGRVILTDNLGELITRVAAIESTPHT